MPSSSAPSVRASAASRTGAAGTDGGSATAMPPRASNTTAIAKPLPNVDIAQPSSIDRYDGIAAARRCRPPYPARHRTPEHHAWPPLAGRPAPSTASRGRADGDRTSLRALSAMRQRACPPVLRGYVAITQRMSRGWTACARTTGRRRNACVHCGIRGICGTPGRSSGMPRARWTTCQRCPASCSRIAYPLNAACTRRAEHGRSFS